MTGIPRRHRAEEFSLHIRYRTMGSGYGKAAIPGFYLDAMFANEGEAHEVVKDLLLSPATLREILTDINSTTQVHGALGGGDSAAGGWVLSEAGKAIAETGVTALRARIATLETQQQTTDEQLHVLRSALAASE